MVGSVCRLAESIGWRHPTLKSNQVFLATVIAAAGTTAIGMLGQPAPMAMGALVATLLVGLTVGARLEPRGGMAARLVGVSRVTAVDGQSYWLWPFSLRSASGGGVPFETAKAIRADFMYEGNFHV